MEAPAASTKASTVPRKRLPRSFLSACAATTSDSPASVTLDRVTQTIQRAGAEAGIDLRLAAAVRVRDRKRWGRWALDLVRIDGTLLTVIYDRVSEGNRVELQAVADAVGEWLRNPAAEVPPELGS